MKSDFRLMGLNKSRTATLHFINTDKAIFWAKINMPKDRFDAMWNYCKDNFNDAKIAEVEHDGYFEDGTPINPVMVSFREWDLKFKPVK